MNSNEINNARRAIENEKKNLRRLEAERERYAPGSQHYRALSNQMDNLFQSIRFAVERFNQRYGGTADNNRVGYTAAPPPRREGPQ